MTSRDRVPALLLMLSIAIGAQLTEPLIQVYVTGLEDMEMKLLEKAFAVALREWDRRVLPLPSELRRFARMPAVNNRTEFLPESGHLPEWKEQRLLTPEERGWPRRLESVRSTPSS